jgi:RHS repeat-associated protein
MLQDHLGSTTELLDTGGATVANSEIAYWPYGGTREGGVTGTDLLYTGQRQEAADAAMGLYNYKARFYSTGVGRFVSVDPIVGSVADPQLWNPYSYVRNNPLGYVDPTGKYFEKPGDAAPPCWSCAQLKVLAGVGWTAQQWASWQQAQVAGALAFIGQQQIIGALAYIGHQQMVGALQFVAHQQFIGALQFLCVTCPRPAPIPLPSPGWPVPVDGAGLVDETLDGLDLLGETLRLPPTKAWEFLTGKDGETEYIPPPRGLDAFPDARRVPPKTGFPGGLRARWKDSDGKIYEWDYQHGRVERYDRRGRHEGDFDPESGKATGPPDSTRRVEP